jgi:VWFA-related protein
LIVDRPAGGGEMLLRWIAVLCMAASLWVSGAQAQQPVQPGSSATAPRNAPSSESEIVTRDASSAIKVRVNLVLVRVVVKDGGGKVVPDLKQEDFQVLDDGKPQKISTFSVETAEKSETAAAVTEKKSADGEVETGAVKAPAMPQRFVALVFDDLHMKAADSMAVRAASKRLFASLTPTDRVAIYSTSGNVQQDFTGDAETLRKTLASIVPHPSKGEGQYDCPNISYYQADLIVNKHDREAIETAVEDAQVNDCPANISADAKRVLEAGDAQTRENYEYLENVVRHLAGMPGLRVLAYVSPGFILPDKIVPDSWEWIEHAVRAGVVVNTIDARGLYTADVMPDIAAPPQVAPYKGPTADYQAIEGTYRVQAQHEAGQVLAAIAANTGGTYFHNRNDLDVGMGQALAVPSVTYMLGFAPQNPVADGKFHKLKVTVAHEKKYKVQARDGYYAPKKLDDPEEMARQEVREALFAQDDRVSIPVTLETESVTADATATQLTVLAHLDISGVQFRKENGLSCNDLVSATALFDRDGQFVDGGMREIALKLKDATVQKMSRTGLTIKIVFRVKPGTYMVRSVVRESEGERLTARSLTKVIPGAPDIVPASTQPAKNEQRKNEQKVSERELLWTPPRVDAQMKSLSMTPACDLSQVLEHTAATAVALALNLEKFTARENIEYVSLGRNGMVERFDSGSFDYVYARERQKGGAVSREYRTPVKGSHIFPGADVDVGQGAAALIFHPDLQPDYEMKCEGMDTRNGQDSWVVHFEQRKDRPGRTAKFWVGDAARPEMLKGRAWISAENFQVVHLEASLMSDLSQIGLQEFAFSVDYESVRSPSGNPEFWLPNKIIIYRDFGAHRVVLDHTFTDFQLFAVDTKEKVQEPKQR